MSNASWSDTDTHWPTVLLVTGAGVVSALQFGKPSIALPALQASLGLGIGPVSWLLAAFGLVGALLGLWVGLRVDVWGARRMLLGGLATLGLLWWLALPPERRELKAAERPVRRLAFVGVGISHSAIGGVALGILLGANPLAVGALFAAAVALGISAAGRRTRRSSPATTAAATLWRAQARRCSPRSPASRRRSSATSPASRFRCRSRDDSPSK